MRGYCQGYLWDSNWYGSIVEYGYRPAGVADERINNVAFFPGFPVAIGIVRTIIPARLDVVVPLTAQIACVVFWIYFFLYLERRRVSRPLQMLGAGFIISHPLGFILVVGYSESLFLALMLGFFFWMRFGKGTTGHVLTAVHGAGMTATRLVGVPLAAIPALRAFIFEPPSGSRRSRNTALFLSLAVAAASVAGAAAYFAYCRWRFGAWDIYFSAEQAGWAATAEYFRFLDLAVYFPRLSLQALQNPGLNDLNRLAIPLTVIALAGIAATDALRCGWKTMRGRAAYYAGSLALLYPAIVLRVAPGGNEIFTSKMRYLFPVHILLLFAVLEMIPASRKKMISPFVVILSCVVFFNLFLLQLRVIQQLSSFAP